MEEPIKLGIDLGSENLKAVLVHGNETRELGPYRLAGKSLPRLLELAESLLCELGPGAEVLLGITGSGSEFLVSLLDMEMISEPQALASAFEALASGFRQVVEIGAQTQKFLSLTRDETSGRFFVDDVIPGGKCAGGTGSFL